MNLREKANFHHDLAQAFQEGVERSDMERGAALEQAKRAIHNLMEVPNTCANPAAKLSKSAALRNRNLQEAIDEISRLERSTFDDDEDIQF